MEIELSRVLQTIRRLWWVIIALPLLLGAIGFGLGSLQSASYEATTQLMVTSHISNEPFFAEAGDTATFETIVTSGPVLDRVILELGLPYTREDLQGMITASTISGTQIIEIRVTADDPQLAADIANALSRNMVLTAMDLSTGDIQRNLDEMQQQSATIRDQIVVIDTRLAELDTPENEDNTEAQVEIAQLERERLGLSQTLADLENTIRTLNSSLSTMSVPVVVTDTATPPQQPATAGRMLLGLLGALLGAFLAAAWILYSAVADRKLRDADQVITGPILERVPRSQLAAGVSAPAAIVAAKVAGASSGEAPYRLAVVAPRERAEVAALHQQLVNLNEGDFSEVIIGNGILDNPELLRSVSRADKLLVVAHLNDTTRDDLVEVCEYADLAKKPVLGTALVV